MIVGKGNIPETTLFQLVIYRSSFSLIKRYIKCYIKRYIKRYIKQYIKWYIKGIQTVKFSCSLAESRPQSSFPRPNHAGLWLLWWMRASLSWPTGRETHWGSWLHTRWSCLFSLLVFFLVVFLKMLHPTWEPYFEFSVIFGYSPVFCLWNPFLCGTQVWVP
jgi:hypothetical protein